MLNFTGFLLILYIFEKKNPMCYLKWGWSVGCELTFCKQCVTKCKLLLLIAESSQSLTGFCLVIFLFLSPLYQYGPFHIPEDAPVGTTVTAVLAGDADVRGGDSWQVDYRFESGNEEEVFTLVTDKQTNEVSLVLSKVSKASVTHFTTLLITHTHTKISTDRSKLNWWVNYFPILFGVWETTKRFILSGALILMSRTIFGMMVCTVCVSLMYVCVHVQSKESIQQPTMSK